MRSACAHNGKASNFQHHDASAENGVSASIMAYGISGYVLSGISAARNRNNIMTRGAAERAGVP